MTVDYRQVNFRSTRPRRRRSIHIDHRLYAAVERMAERQRMTVPWFIEECLEIAVGVDAKLAKVAKVKPAYQSRRQIGE
jgi:hypothetical protein